MSIATILVAHNGGLFGAERSLLSLALGLHARPDFEPLVLVPFEGPLARCCRERGLPVRVTGHRQWVSPNRSPQGVAKRWAANRWALAKTVRRLGSFAPDIVYTGTGTTPFGAMLARRTGAAHVWHLREYVDADYGVRYDRGRRASWRYIAGRADRLVANTRAIRQHFAPRLGRGDIEVIYNGFEFLATPSVDAAALYRKRVEEADAVELLLVGALVEGKGQHVAIRALAELVRRGRRVQLRLAGDGPADYRGELERLVAAHGLGEAVTFMGFIPDCEPLYQRAAITLVCSRCEAFGRTAVESLHAGTPVIGTEAGGLPEILRSREIGALFPVGDWMALADRIEELLDDRARYLAIAGGGPDYVRQHFSAERYVNRLARLFENLVADPRGVSLPGAGTAGTPLATRKEGARSP